MIGGLAMCGKGIGERSSYGYRMAGIGKITLHCEGDAIIALEMNAPERADGPPPLETEALAEASRQLGMYLGGRRRSFDLRLEPRGTPFQRMVWEELMKIPFGQSLTYGQLATRLGTKKAARAVAGACGRNPLAIFIPCHRVVASNGAIGGYFWGVAIKRMLLTLEKSVLDRGEQSL
ncbi:MAG: methylated-DNA--[protein]-cysteine S-methyltransferase [Rickettsiales bacterium]|jgi:methylated-DNA-[protein]-cysteine S-methyltransferase|nr:methylated-DNA--[protein]-cysteine S-methyltransferase [Rickettsiales bacterium]